MSCLDRLGAVGLEISVMHDFGMAVASGARINRQIVLLQVC